MAVDGVELLRFVHVVAAALWAGAAIFGFVVLMPAIKAAGEAGQGFMQAVERRGGFGRYMMPLALVTILSGAWLYWQRGYHVAPFGSIASAMVTIGALAGLAVVVLGLVYAMPKQRRMKSASTQIGPEGPTPEQQATLAGIGASLAKAGLVSTVLIGLALVLMVGRFVVT